MLKKIILIFMVLILQGCIKENPITTGQTENNPQNKVTVSYPTNEGRNEDGRYALVIGNASYKSSPLDNPVNDAQDMATSLRQLGFFVIEKQNCSKKDMVESIREFGKLIAKGGVGLFYYAGHGMQINGKNYLIPINANIQHEDEVAYEMSRKLALQMGLFVGMSSGAAVAGALKVAAMIDHGTIVTLLPDRGDRYLSTNLFRSQCAMCPP